MGLELRLRTARLYLSTDLRSDPGDFRGFLEAVFAGGVDVVQVRAPGATTSQLLEGLNIARSVAHHYQGLVVVNGSPELAQEFLADVLHLSQADPAPAVARPLLHQWALIGQSAHDEQQLATAAADPEVNYLSVGPVHLSQPHPDYRAPGLELVRAAAALQPPAELTSKPWFASGGIDEDTLDEVLAAGARRVWVTRAITRAADAQAAAGRLSRTLREVWNNDPAMQRYLAAVYGLGTSAPEGTA